jgi:hypothetical protein
VGRLVSRPTLSAQPMIRRSNKSITTVRYRKPAAERSYVLSDTPCCPQWQAENPQFSRFSQTGRPWRELDVRVQERRRRALRLFSRINRATVFRLARLPSIRRQSVRPGAAVPAVLPCDYLPDEAQQRGVRFPPPR